MSNGQPTAINSPSTPIFLFASRGGGSAPISLCRWRGALSFPSPFSHSKERPWDPNAPRHVRHSHHTRSHHITSRQWHCESERARSLQPGFVKHQAAERRRHRFASIQDPPLLKAKGRERDGWRATSICSLTTCCLHATALKGAPEINGRGFVDLHKALTKRPPPLETPCVEMEAENGLGLSPPPPRRPRCLIPPPLPDGI